MTMEPLEIETVVNINHEWFKPKFEKAIKRYIKDECKRELLLSDLLKIIFDANRI